MILWLLSMLAMVLGFGFVIFWHELGHFLGARWAGIRVEQFAVGMGNALVSYRKGIGVRRGNTMAEFDARIDAEIARRRQSGESRAMYGQDPTLAQRYEIAGELGLGETEYRLSSLPIGGYVKPTGQDDLRPAAQAAADDSHSYAAAPVGKRMVMISAGVIMNVILAAILFFVLFRFVGFDAMQPIVGNVQSNSPAANVGLRAGDELLELNGHTLHDFTKILMNVALLPDDEPVKLRYRRDGQESTVDIQARYSIDNSRMLALGLSPAYLLRGIDPAKLVDGQAADAFEDVPIRPGDAVVSVAGQPVTSTDYAVLDQAVQRAFGKPVEIAVKAADGAVRTETLKPSFAAMFNRDALAFLGLTPGTQIAAVQPNSSVKDKLKAGDVILRMQIGQRTLERPTVDAFITAAKAAGAAGDAISFTLLRDGARVEVPDVRPATKLPGGGVGLGVATTIDAQHAVVASSTNDALPIGTTLSAIGGEAVSSWYDVHRVLATAAQPGAVELSTVNPDGVAGRVTVQLTDADLNYARSIRYGYALGPLEEWQKRRETHSALTAVQWGVEETRDLILQGYLTIRRVVTGSVPASNMSGPVGIFHAGTKFAQRGGDWFIWFLAVISANLAVVNFLPVPILDGWHFLSLVKEKVTGRPLSERVQEVAQYVGLAMILSLIVFVTYNDIARLLFG